jgi:hypothetical protein
VHDDFSGNDLELRAQRERTITQLGHAYALVRRLEEMGETSIDQFVSTLLEADAAEEIDTMLEHLDVAAGAWRELADQADRVIEGVAAAFTRAVLARAATVESGSA